MNSNLGRPTVPEGEITVDFVRSSGPGGQNVNKVSSKARLRWRVGASAAFSDEQKAAIRRRAGHRLNAADEIVLAADAQRAQSQNRVAVTARLRKLVAEALTPLKPRRPTTVSRAQKQRRLDAKRVTSRKKQLRRTEEGEW